MFINSHLLQNLFDVANPFEILAISGTILIYNNITEIDEEIWYLLQIKLKRVNPLRVLVTPGKAPLGICISTSWCLKIVNSATGACRLCLLMVRMDQI